MAQHRYTTLAKNDITLNEAELANHHWENEAILTLRLLRLSLKPDQSAAEIRQGVIAAMQQFGENVPIGLIDDFNVDAEINDLKGKNPRISPKRDDVRNSLVQQSHLHMEYPNNSISWQECFVRYHAYDRSDYATPESIEKRISTYTNTIFRAVQDEEALEILAANADITSSSKRRLLSAFMTAGVSNNGAIKLASSRMLSLRQRQAPTPLVLVSPPDYINDGPELP